jgi:trans-aconitate methyltransferase
MSTVPAEYYENPRTELLALFPAAPRRLLDVGCGAGATSAAAKARWPGVETIGIELVPEVAARARAVVDRVIEGSAESLDLAAAGLGEPDGVLLADVLEHMVDPWTFLARLRPLLAPGATVAASIPNIANLWLMEELAAGRFRYEPSGLLDVTHLRFFTRSSIVEMFERAGYRIRSWDRIIDSRVDPLTDHLLLGRPLPRRIAGWVRGRKVVLQGTSAASHDDLRTLQFLVIADPGKGPMGALGGN